MRFEHANPNRRVRDAFGSAPKWTAPAPSTTSRRVHRRCCSSCISFDDVNACSFTISYRAEGISQYPARRLGHGFPVQAPWMSFPDCCNEVQYLDFAREHHRVEAGGLVYLRRLWESIHISTLDSLARKTSPITRQIFRIRVTPRTLSNADAVSPLNQLVSDLWT